jgi:hypothetical protein
LEGGIFGELIVLRKLTLISRTGFAAVAGLMLALAVYDSTLAQSANSSEAPAPVRLVDGAWSFSVDRDWRPPGGRIARTLSLPESDFRPAVPVRLYRLTVSASGAKMQLQGPDGPAIFGVLREGSDPVVFDLREGVFAGGSFTVTQRGDSIGGELMIYGSGVLVISCARGKISRQQIGASSARERAAQLNL